MIPDDCKPCPEGRYCPGQQACECGTKTMGAMRRELEDAVISELKGLRAQLTSSQQTALDYHRRWQEAEAKMVAMEEARNTAMKAEGEAKADVKLLREALEGVMTSTRIQAGICGAVDTAVAALAATEPKGEQGCQSKS